MRESGPIRTDAALIVDVVDGCGGRLAGEPAIAEACRVAAATAYQHLAGGAAAVCVLLTGDALMRDLNQRFRQIDRPTNVLSFAGDTADVMEDTAAERRLGDIAISLEAVEREAVAEGKPMLDHLQHLTVHAILHLLGYDHETDVEAAMMERTEVEILAALGVDDPYRDRDDGRT
ncbi:MAG: rRNA maturation RNase YbeY [Rhodospirillales bacterium]|jgi:probable rRNA maturation factor|nr:rRNA maturation RNase YbeY [Rhodospirillales bacterium]